VVQFRQRHFLQARARHVLDAELPDVRDALVAAGAVRVDPLSRMPPSIVDREPRPGDERLATLTARRPTIEQVFGRAAEAEARMDVRRGISAAGLTTRMLSGTLHVTGVRTESGETLTGDLVVDAMGRRSLLPRLLRDSGGDPVYDAWACTNPSLGRGIPLGLVHSARLRDVARTHLEDPRAFTHAWHVATERELTPWYRATLAVDRARLAEIDALRTGRQPPAPLTSHRSSARDFPWPCSTTPTYSAPGWKSWAA
jgi:hypothetical protein